MVFWIRIALLLLALTPFSRAAADCKGLEGRPKIECEAGLMLNHGIARFQKREYAGAKEVFLRVVQRYPQATEAVARARFYSGECDRLGAGKPSAPVKKVLKFKPSTTRGQILSPGEKPAAVTLQDSQKDLTPGTTQQDQKSR